MAQLRQLDLRRLLPPLLACLPTACVSPSPPPALLPLLSPILRQRVQFLSADSSPSESWLPLLCWSTEKASRLREVIESDRFELHPVSGEVEFKDVEAVTYKKLDEETLQAKVVLRELGILVIYLWCIGDPEGGGDGWKVVEVSVTGDAKDLMDDWHVSISAASEARDDTTAGLLHGNGDGTLFHQAAQEGLSHDKGSDDDDAYWRQYDDSPAPQIRPEKPSSVRRAVRDANEHHRTTSEDEYFSQYAQVQPALDNDDTSFGNGDNAKHGAHSFSALDIDKPIQNRGLNIADETPLPYHQIVGGYPSDTDPAAFAESRMKAKSGTMYPLSHPRPSSSSSSGSSVVARLEQSAASGVWAEIGVKQHLSASIKSLFRVARTAGVDSNGFGKLLRGEISGCLVLEESRLFGAHQYISSSFYGLLRPARLAGIDNAEIERIVSTELAVLEIIDNEDAGVDGSK